MQNFLYPNTETKPVSFYDITTERLHLNNGDRNVYLKYFDEKILKANEYQFQKNILNFEDQTILKYQRINNLITLHIKVCVSNLNIFDINEVYIRLPSYLCSNDIYTNNNLEISNNILKIKLIDNLKTGQKMESKFCSINYYCN
jgi:hypothetical protein